MHETLLATVTLSPPEVGSGALVCLWRINIQMTYRKKKGETLQRQQSTRKENNGLSWSAATEWKPSALNASEIFNRRRACLNTTCCWRDKC